MTSIPSPAPPRRRQPQRLSPTAINTYLTCPQRFAWRYLDGLRPPEAPSWPLALGRVVHEALRDFFRAAPARRNDLLLHNLARRA